GRGGCLHRQSGLQPGVAPDVVHLLAVLLHATGDHVLDLAGLNPGALDQLAVAATEQRVGMGVLVVALLLVPAPDRRADCFDDDYLATAACVHVVLLISPVISG